MNSVSLTVWVVFNVILVALLILDLFVLSKRIGRGKFKAALLLSLFWVVVGLSTSIYVFVELGTEPGIEYLAAYVTEKSLGVDNLFVFIILFTYFKLPQQLESYALTLGIAGALIARAVFIAIGVSIVSAASFLLLPLGAFLVYTAYKIWWQDITNEDPSKSLAVRLARKILPISGDFEKQKLFTKVDGRLLATPLLLVVVSLMFSDLLFAIDSIPTVIGITQNSFIVWFSNATAVLGLRPLFFLLIELVDRFKYLHKGLSLVLGYIGLKLLFEEGWHLITGEKFEIFGNLLDTILPLSVVVVLLVGSIVLSIVLTRNKKEV